MIRLSIHTGRLSTINERNRLASLDIGYDNLKPIADYKAVLFRTGRGATPPVMLTKYPRWGGSLWDLASRALCLSLTYGAGEPVEAPPPFTQLEKRRAFMESLSARIEHLPGGDTIHSTVLAEAEVLQDGRSRGHYIATFTEDTQARHVTESFCFYPHVIDASELLLRAALVRLGSGMEKLPPRPSLSLPASVLVGKTPCVPLHELAEPAQTGFKRWLYANSEEPLAYEGASLGVAPETLYIAFLESAL